MLEMDWNQKQCDMCKNYWVLLKSSNMFKYFVFVKKN